MGATWQSLTSETIEQMNNLGGGGACSQDWIYNHVFVQLEMVFVMTGRVTCAEVANNTPYIFHYLWLLVN